jgi:hypothetical protein
MKRRQDKIRSVSERIVRLKAGIDKARAYLESGQHAHWSGFRPLFMDRRKNGVACLPHEDWVRNFFLPNWERALARAEKVLERLHVRRGG